MFYLYSYLVVHSFLSQTVLHSRTSLHSLFLPSIDLTLAQVGKGDAFSVTTFALLLCLSILATTVWASIVLSKSVKHFISILFSIYKYWLNVFLVWPNVSLSSVFWWLRRNWEEYKQWPAHRHTWAQSWARSSGQKDIMKQIINSIINDSVFRRLSVCECGCDGL